MDFGQLIRSKLDDFKNAVAQNAGNLGNDFNNLGNTIQQNLPPLQAAAGFIGQAPIPIVPTLPPSQSPTIGQVVSTAAPIAQAFPRIGFQAAQTISQALGNKEPPYQPTGGEQFFLGNSPLKSYQQQIAEANQFLQRPQVGNLKLPGVDPFSANQAAPMIVGAGVLSNFMGLGGPEEKLAATEAINIAQKSNTVEDFAKALGQAKPEVQSTVTNALKDPNVPVNTLEDFFNKAKGITAPVSLKPAEETLPPKLPVPASTPAPQLPETTPTIRPSSGSVPQDPFIADLEVNKNMIPGMPETKPTVPQMEKSLLPPKPPVTIPTEPSDITLKQAAKNAISEMTGVKQNIEQAGSTAAQYVSKGVSPEETKLFRSSIEHPEQLTSVLDQVKNQSGFQSAVDTFRKFTDYVHNQYNSTGDKLGYVKNFYSHIVDLSDPATKLKYEGYMNQVANAKGWFTKSRVFQNIDELEKAGFKLKNNTVPEDIVQYSNSVQRSAGAQAFVREIQKTHPNDIAVLKDMSYIPRDAEGRPFRQLNIPSMEATFVSPNLYSHVKKLEPSAFQDAPVMKLFDKVNTGVKAVQLGLGGFHAFKTTIRQVVNNPVIIPRALLNAVNPAARLAFRQRAIDEGVVEAASKMGVTLGRSDNLLPDASVAGKILSKNPLEKFNQGLFGGLIDTYKLDTVRHAMGKFDLNNPAELQKARDLGAQINNLFGGLNYDVLGRNKTFQQLIRAVTLAPDFNEGKIRQILTSADLRDWSPAALFARKNLIGEAVVVGIIAELGRKLTTGNFDTNLKDVVTHAILNPSFPLPSQFDNPKNGKPQQAGIPGSDLSDIYRATQDFPHFLQARGSAAIGLGTKIATGKDYYGNPLVNPYNGTPDNLVNRLKAAAPSEIPIPGVQALKVAQGLETPQTAALNTLGFRVSTDQSTPQAQATTAYFNNLNQVANTLNPNDKQTFLGLLHPTTKDPDGNPVVTKTPFTKSTQYDALLNNQNLFNAEVALQQSQPNHNPIWDQDPAVLRQYLHYEFLDKSAPGSAEEKQYLKNTPTVLPLIKASDQFNANLAATLNLPQSGPVPPPISTYVQQQLDSATPNYNDPQVSSYLAQHLDYVNAQRAAVNLAPLDKYGNIQGSKSYAGPGGTGGGSSYRPRVPFALKNQFTKARHITAKKVQIKLPKTTIAKAPKLKKTAFKVAHHKPSVTLASGKLKKPRIKIA